jgi:branched-chain amino acid transport system permease protein
MSGVNAAGYRTRAFIVGAACAGVAGALYAPFVSYISPEAFTLSVSINMVTMAVIGGLGNLIGGVVGAVAIILAPEYLRFLGEYRLIVYGAIMIIFMMFFPGGVTGLFRQPTRKLIGLVQRLVGTSPPNPSSEARNS